MKNFGTKRGRLLGGIKAGQSNVLNNQKDRIGIFAPGVQRSAAIQMLHNRWHIKRRVANPSCYLCRKEKTNA